MERCIQLCMYCVALKVLADMEQFLLISGAFSTFPLGCSWWCNLSRVHPPSRVSSVVVLIVPFVLSLRDNQDLFCSCSCKQFLTAPSQMFTLVTTVVTLVTPKYKYLSQHSPGYRCPREGPRCTRCSDDPCWPWCAGKPTPAQEGTAWWSGAGHPQNSGTARTADGRQAPGAWLEGKV